MDTKEKSCAICRSKSACFKQLSILELELTDAHRVELKYKKGEHIAKQRGICYSCTISAKRAD